MTRPSLALQTPPQTTDLGRLGALWQAADDLGFAAAFTFDHLVPLQPGERPADPHRGRRDGVVLDGWLTAAALAGRTTNLRVGTLVSGVTYRPAGLLAKLAVTLDHVSGGRAILGVGAGWHREEHEMYGLPFPPRADRLTLLRETLEAFRLLCSTDVVSYPGSQVTLREALFEPKPVSPAGIPVLVGGSSAEVMGIAGALGDVYNGFQPPAAWAGVHERLDAACAAAGRAPDTLSRSAFLHLDLRQDDDALVAALRGYDGIGLAMLVVAPGPDVTPDDLARVAKLHADG